MDSKRPAIHYFISDIIDSAEKECGTTTKAEEKSATHKDIPKLKNYSKKVDIFIIALLCFYVFAFIPAATYLAHHIR